MRLIQLHRTGLQEQISEAIRQRIIYGDYPPGTRLNIDRLAQEMKVSTTPVREALARLVADRLVAFEPNKGYRVTPPPDAAWLSDLFDVRMLVEPYAAGVGAARRDPAVLERLTECQDRIAALKQDDITACHRFIELNKEFHTEIVRSAGNRALYEQYIILSYHAQVVLVYRMGLMDIPMVLSEHVPILAAYRQGDGAAAEKAMRDHIKGGKGRAVDFVVETKASFDPASSSL